MRTALTAHANPSHLVGVLAAARVAALAGHEVAVVSGPSVADRIERAGFTALTVPSMLSTEELLGAMPAARAARPSGGGAPRPPAHPFVTPGTGRQAAEVTEALAKWEPDCVLRDSTDLSGYLAAECLGVPYGAVDIAPLSPCGRPGALAELNRVRAECDLPPVDDPWHPVRPFRVGLVPDVFYPDELRWPGAHYYRPSTVDHLGTVRRPAGDGPLVLASLGMNAPRFDTRATAVLNAVIEGLAGLPVTGVVAIGSDYDPDTWDGARAANVHLESFVAQRAILASCDVFITHAGFNGVREAIGAGVPMVAVPLFGDHHASATRLTDLGVAVELDVAAVSADAVRTAVATVLDDPAYRDRAGELRHRMDALPPLDRMVDDLAASMWRDFS